MLCIQILITVVTSVLGKSQNKMEIIPEKILKLLSNDYLEMAI